MEPGTWSALVEGQRLRRPPTPDPRVESGEASLTRGEPERFKLETLDLGLRTSDFLPEGQDQNPLSVVSGQLFPKPRKTFRMETAAGVMPGILEA